MKYRPKHVLEYGLLRAVSGLICVMPYRMALAVGWLLAALIFYVFRFRRAMAERRIREVLGDDLPAARVKHIAWVSMRNTVFNGIEMMRVPRMNESWLRERFNADAIERFKKIHSEGEGAVFALPHMGNWDLAGLAALAHGVPLFAITARQKNPLTSQWMLDMRGHTGMELLIRDTPILRQTFKNLRGGKVLAIQGDLRSKTPGVMVDFLGGQANLVGGTGVFANQTGTPVYPIILRREGWTKHIWELYDPVIPDKSLEKEEDIKRIIQHVANVIDEAVRRHPEDFFWYNKRWVLDPLEVETPAAQ